MAATQTRRIGEADASDAYMAGDEAFAAYMARPIKTVACKECGAQMIVTLADAIVESTCPCAWYPMPSHKFEADAVYPEDDQCARCGDIRSNHPGED